MYAEAMTLTLYTCTCMCMHIWYTELQNYSTKQDRNWRLNPNIYDAIWSHAIYKSQRVHYKITWLNVTYDVLYRIELLSILYNGTKLYATKSQRVYSGTSRYLRTGQKCPEYWGVLISQVGLVCACTVFRSWTLLTMARGSHWKAGAYTVTFIVEVHLK